jgi:multidrug resistance efflux pump
MSAPFHRTVSAVESDGHGRTLLIVSGLSVFIAAVAAWLGLARLNVYVVSDSARVEVELAAHPVQAAIGGRILSVSQVRLGDQVSAGSPLIVLDSSASQIELERTRAICLARSKSLLAQRTALDAQLTALDNDTQAADAAANAASTRERAAQSLADVAAESSRLAGVLRNNEVLSQRDLLREQATAEEKQGAALALSSEVRLTAAEGRVKLSDRVSALAERRVLIAELEGQVAECDGDSKRLAYEIELHSVRAPVDGYVAELHPATPGELLAAGAGVASIVPLGTPRAVAEFAPGASAGRVRPGQHLRLALEGFPWTQYGFVEGVVTRVASEPRAGKIRVECSLLRKPTGVKLLHGLPGRVEIVVERLSPWTLLLRAAGQLALEPEQADPASVPEPAAAPPLEN